MKGCGYYQWEVVSQNGGMGVLGDPKDSRRDGILYDFFTCDLPIYCVGSGGWIISHWKGATQNNWESRLEGETPDLSIC